MTLQEAIDTLVYGSYESFVARCIPFGRTERETITQVIDFCYGTDMDVIAKSYFGIQRYLFTASGMAETDADLRERIHQKIRQTVYFPFVPDTHSCAHNFVTYDSGWSRYDYCTLCDEKKT